MEEKRKETVNARTEEKPVSDVATSSSNPKLDKKDEVEEMKRKRREREPLYYCKVITKYPKTAFGELGTGIDFVVGKGLKACLHHSV